MGYTLSVTAITVLCSTGLLAYWFSRVALVMRDSEHANRVLDRDLSRFRYLVRLLRNPFGPVMTA